MKKILHTIKVMLRPIMLLSYGFYRNYIYRKKIIGRVACLGRDVFNMSFPTFSNSDVLVNQQKVRIDLFMEWLHGSERLKACEIKRFMEREDIYSLIEQQEVLPWLQIKKPVSCFIMDSFAELTDQKFTHRKEGWSFCAHYSDLKHTPEFESLFTCTGLMDENLFEEMYREFFTWVAQAYPHVPIIFIHYPTVLDNREKFTSRAENIKKAITTLQKEFTNLHTIEVHDSEVVHHEGDQFPYHYGSQTMHVFDLKFRALKKQVL